MVNMAQRVPLMILPPAFGLKLSRLFRGVSEKIVAISPSLKYELVEADLDLDDKKFVSLVLANSMMFFLLFAGPLIFLYLKQGKGLQMALLQGIGYAFLIFAIIFYVLFRYPKILAGKKAEMIDKHLLYALKDLKLQISSGVTFYNAIVNISKEDYGLASIEFGKAAKAINTGTPLDQALEKMALESKSDFLKKTIWQLINTIKSGATLKTALETLIKDLTMDQRDKIKSYGQELNLWAMIYMLFAVAVPTMGATLMVILSSFAGFGITKEFFVIFIIICFLIQSSIIGFVKTRRPVVI